MKQNIYDDEKFFNQYEELRNEQKDKNANDLIEIPNFRKLMPDVTNKSILDLGCGYGENDKFFKEQGAKYVLGTDISEKMIEKANEINKIDGIEYKVIAMEDISSIDKKFKRDKIDTLTRDILLKNVDSIIISQDGEVNIKFK